MIPVMCVVQQGQVSADVEDALKAEIDVFAQRAFREPADIDWIEVPEGSGFTAGKPSTTVIASLQSSKALEHDERVALLKQLCDICMDKTGRSSHEVVTSIRDPR